MTYHLKHPKTGDKVVTPSRVQMASLVRSGYHVIETSWS